MTQPETLLVATVGSPSCQRAEDTAIQRVKEVGGEVVFVYVAEASFLNTLTRLTHHLRETERSLENIGRIILKRAANKAEEAGVDHDTELRTGGPILDHILDVAGERDAAAIYLGGATHSPLFHEDHVDEDALRERAGVPVHVIEAEDGDDEIE